MNAFYSSLNFLQGSYYCGLCDDGYIATVKGGCIVDDFCKSGEHKCDTNADCIYQRPGEYICEVSL